MSDDWTRRRGARTIDREQTDLLKPVNDPVLHRFGNDPGQIGHHRNRQDDRTGVDEIQTDVTMFLIIVRLAWIVAGCVVMHMAMQVRFGVRRSQVRV